MNTMDSKKRAELRAEAQKIKPVMIIGKRGITDEAVAELRSHLKRRRLVKVKLPKETSEGVGPKKLAEELAVKMCAELVEVRGSTAVISK